MAELNLKNIPVFSDLKGKELDELSQRVKEHNFDVGDTIIREGKVEEEEDRRMYVIKEGEVEVLKEDWAMNQIRLNTLGRGSFFGEMSLIDNENRSATVRALSDTILYSLSCKDLRSVLSEDGYTKVILNVGGGIGERMREGFTRLADILKGVKLD